MKRLFQTMIGILLLTAGMMTGVIPGSGVLQAEAAGNPTTINTCMIDAKGANVNVTASTAALPASDDGNFYLFAEKIYENALTGAPVASAAKGTSAVFTFPLNKDTASSMLYNKFVVAVRQGGTYVPVSAAHFITNPEAIATRTGTRRNSSKKGLILDAAKINNDEALKLGVKQAAYNVFLEDFINTRGSDVVNYTYNGKTYAFNQSALNSYDHAFGTFTKQGMSVTVVVLNRYNAGYEYMQHPLSRDGGASGASYYMLNTADVQGTEELEAVMSFLANRYGASVAGSGQIDNWVIGNEVNARLPWNYTSNMDVSQYSQIYADSLRICYNAIRSQNANATVSMCIDQEWKRNSKGVQNYYDGRDMVDQVNSYLTSQGNIDWSLAAHPYPVPLTWAKFWSTTPFYASLVKHSLDTPFITMENIEQLTDYMCQPAMRNIEGQVRPVFLTEVGYTAAQGEDIQAADLVYAYQRAMNNQYIKTILFSRQTDSAEEIAQGLSMGLTNPNGSHKLGFEFYQNMDGANAAAYIERARATIGFPDWNAQMYPR